MLQRILNTIREIRIRKRLNKAIYSTSGIDKVEKKHLNHIVNGLARSLSISLYKDVRVSSSKRRFAYRYNRIGKGKIHSYLSLEIKYKKGCCETEKIVLKNPRRFWQLHITTEDKSGNIKIQEPVDALIYLKLAKPKP